MKLYSLYDRSGSILAEKVSLEMAMTKIPAGAHLISGNTYNKDGTIKEIKAVFKVPAKGTYELIEVK